MFKNKYFSMSDGKKLNNVDKRFWIRTYYISDEWHNRKYSHQNSIC